MWFSWIKAIIPFSKLKRYTIGQSLGRLSIRVKYRYQCYFLNFPALICLVPQGADRWTSSSGAIYIVSVCCNEIACVSYGFTGHLRRLLDMSPPCWSAGGVSSGKRHPCSIHYWPKSCESGQVGIQPVTEGNCIGLLTRTVAFGHSAVGILLYLASQESSHSWAEYFCWSSPPRKCLLSQQPRKKKEEEEEDFSSYISSYPGRLQLRP